MRHNKLVRKVTTIFILYTLYVILNTRCVFADVTSAYNDYQYQYAKYRESYQNFQSSKATYKTYQTLTTKNDAIEKMRSAAISRDEVLKSFLTLVTQKMSVVPDAPVQNFETQKSWLTSHQQQLSAAATLEDLNTVSSNFDQKYPDIINVAKQGIGDISLTQMDHLASKTDDFLSKTSAQIDRLQQVGEENSLLKRNWQTAKAKSDLYDAKKTSAKTSLYPKDNYNKEVNLVTAQSFLNEGLNYLKETTSYLIEIIKNVTG